jgi:hypothetical protein
MREAALAYRAEGFRVFPLAPRDKVPLIAGGRGCHDATTDESQIRAWWSACPDANIAVATGNGLLVVDLDGDDGCISLGVLCAEYGALPVTRCVSTGRVGGFHFWLRATGPAVRNSTGKRNGLAPGIDTRGAGGYVVAPPSVHPSGLAYKSSPTAPIADAPAWLLALLTPKVVERTGAPIPPTISDETTPYGRKAIELECEKVRSAPKGTRNEQLNASAYSLGQLEAGGEIAFGDAGPALEEAACAAGLPTSRSQKTIYTSGLVKGRENPRIAPKTAMSHQAHSSGAATTAVEQIIARVGGFAVQGRRDALADVISALGGQGQIAYSDIHAAGERANELATIAAHQRRGDRLARALQIVSNEQKVA